MTEKEIRNEIEKLIKIFQLEIKNEDKEKIINNTIKLSKKENIYRVALAISIFIETIGAIKTDFFKKIKKIITDLENSNDEKIIINSLNDMKNENINIEELYNKNIKGNNYLNILLKLKEQPEAITFLIENNIENCQNLQDLINETSNSLLNFNEFLI